MPKPHFLKDMRRLGDADVAHIIELARCYRTSLEATINRYVELTDNTCAFVLSKDGLIRYVRATKNLPRLTHRTKAPLPLGCPSLSVPSSVLRKPSTWQEVDGGVWLDIAYGSRTPDLLEQSMRQANGYQTTLLFLDEASKEEQDEDAELEEHWSPPFSRR